MKKHFLFSASALFLVCLYFNWTAISSIASTWLAPTDHSSSVDGDASKDLLDPTGQGDLLERLAAGNELFQWSIDLENKNSSGEIFASPTRSQFRAWFDADPSSQSWEDYFGWVEVFYKGNFVSQGWVRTAKEYVESSGEADAVRVVNILGRVLAAEWSKSNEVRRINNSDMYRWGKSLQSKKATLKEIAKEAFDKLNQNKSGESK